MVIGDTSAVSRCLRVLRSKRLVTRLHDTVPVDQLDEMFARIDRMPRRSFETPKRGGSERRVGAGREVV